MSARGSAAGDRIPRIAYLSFSTGEYDARTFRMARSALDAGYEVTVYARWHPGLPPVEERDGYRIVRAPFDPRLAIPILRGPVARRLRRAMAAEAARHAAADGGGVIDDEGSASAEAPGAGGAPDQVSLVRRLLRPPLRAVMRWYRRWRRMVMKFPLRPLGWAHALDGVAEPADIWHGMWAGSLPALERMQARHGGRTIYDSRDVYMLSREYATAGRPGKTVLERLERRWAHRVDRVLTVNESYADLLVERLGIERPAVVMNCPVRWMPPEPPPDLIRAALGLDPSTIVVLYQGRLMSDRGIEQSMDAILDVPGAVLGLLGFGDWLERYTEITSKPPYRGRVAMLPAVPPEALLEWTASADVSVMAIQPTSINHRYTTPQKLFESLAAGVPIVAADLPGLAEVIEETGAGVLCDPTSPAAIAAAIRRIVDAPADERRAMHDRALRAAHDRYNWEAQLGTLFAVYRELLGRPAPAATEAQLASATPEATPRPSDAVDPSEDPAGRA